jgi:hypothetical protein
MKRAATISPMHPELALLGNRPRRTSPRQYPRNCQPAIFESQAIIELNRRWLTVSRVRVLSGPDIRPSRNRPPIATSICEKHPQTRMCVRQNFCHSTVVAGSPTEMAVDAVVANARCQRNRFRHPSARKDNSLVARIHSGGERHHARIGGADQTATQS